MNDSASPSSYITLFLPVVKVRTVSEVPTAQLARFPDISETCQHGHLHRIVFTDAVKLLPTLRVPPAHAIKFHAQFPGRREQMQNVREKPNEYLSCAKLQFY